METPLRVCTKSSDQAVSRGICPYVRPVSLSPAAAWTGPLAEERARGASTSDLLESVFAGGDEGQELAELIEHTGEGLASTASPTIPVQPGDGAALILAAMRELVRRLDLPASPTGLRRPADVAAIAMRELGGREHERLLVIACDAANRPIATVTVAAGGVDRCPFPVCDTITAVLRRDGRAFALAHNHPTGDAYASDADVAATIAVAEAARVVGLRFLGHVIVTDNGWLPVNLRP